ncbi:MAG: HEPN domain-containing protein [Chloroflexi bacterium]|nr:HEPN domain-containing protein [Chloroflexota bacterium]
MDETVRRWLIKAVEDIRTIEHEMKLPEGEVVTSAVCFHAQQAVEKLLKGFLVSRKVEFGRTYNLSLLVNLCAKQDEDFRDLDVGRLSFYGVEVRYPDEFYVPSFREAQVCSKIAADVKQFVLGRFGFKDDKEFTGR